jgi:hypothetical protein
MQAEEDYLSQEDEDEYGETMENGEDYFPAEPPESRVYDDGGDEGDEDDEDDEDDIYTFDSEVIQRVLLDRITALEDVLDAHHDQTALHLRGIELLLNGLSREITRFVHYGAPHYHPDGTDAHE